MKRNKGIQLGATLAAVLLVLSVMVVPSIAQTEIGDKTVTGVNLSMPDTLTPEFQSLSEEEKDKLFEKMKNTELPQSELFVPGEIEYTVNDVGKINQKKSTSGDTSIAATKTVYVMVVADEEFRSRFGSQWKSQALKMLEGGDDAFNYYHEIDMMINYYYETWDSNDAGTFSDLRAEAASETGWNSGQKHGCTMLAIFTDQSDGNLAGQAERPGDTWIMRSQGNFATDHHVSEHEMSHNYDCPDHPDTWDPNDPCIMARVYDTYWWDESCDTIIENNKYTYPA